MKIEGARVLILLVAGCAAGGERREDPPAIRSLWDYHKPAETRQKLEALLQDLDEEDHRPYALEVRTQIARTHGLEGDFESAHRILDEVESTLDDAPAVVRIRYLLERGRAFNSGGKPVEARPLFLDAWRLGREAEEEARDRFRQAHEILGQDAWLVKHEPERLERMKRLAGAD